MFWKVYFIRIKAEIKQFLSLKVSFFLTIPSFVCKFLGRYNWM